MATTRTLTGKVFVIIDPVEVQRMMFSGQAGVVRNLFVRGERVKKLAIRLAPKVTGNLADHIVKRLVKSKGKPVMLVGVEHVPYAVFVHEGTRPHPIDAVHAPFLVFVGRDGKLVATKHVDHPGNKPNRFLVRALTAAA